MVTSDIDRRRVTFAQAEGVQALPSQLEPKVLPQALRVRLAKVVLESMNRDKSADSMGYMRPTIAGNWRTILYDKHVLFDDKFPEDFSTDFEYNYLEFSNLFRSGDYVSVLGTIQYILRHRKAPVDFSKNIEWALQSTYSAYRVVDGDTIYPVAGSGDEQVALRALSDLTGKKFEGARAHLKLAASGLTAGAWAQAVRESIHAVESVIRILTSSNSVSGALKTLRAAHHININMSSALERLYNYTSDESGIRHALLEEGDAKVDEADALFMFGACCSFVTYLIAKSGAQA